MAERNPFFSDTEVSAAEDYTGTVLPWAYDYATDSWKPAVPRIISDAAKATKRAAELPSMNLWDVVGSQDFGKAKRDISDIPTEFVMDAWMPGGAAAATKFGVVGDATLGTIKGYHGTPYRFEPVDHNPFGAFKNEAIGSGEGAQAYGWGHYVAGREGTAKYYKETLGSNNPDSYLARQVMLDGKQIANNYDEYQALPLHIKMALGEYTYNNFDADKAIDRLKIDSDPAIYGQDTAEVAAEAATWLKDNKSKIKREEPGSLYTIDIDLEPEQLLDWDAPAAQQKHLWEALTKAGFPFDDEVARSTVLEGRTGNQLYNMLVRDKTDAAAKDDFNGFFDSHEAAVSKALAAAGIPGIKYLDQGSRNPNKRFSVWSEDTTQLGDNRKLNLAYFPTKEEAEAEIASRKQYSKLEPKLHEELQTYNYVIFDPKHLRITARNGVPLERVEHDPFTRDLEAQLDAAKRTGNRPMIEQLERQLKKARTEI